MNRLQKKCVIATAGLHLLLLAILFLGPAFFNSKPKVDNTPVLDVIPANLIDAAFNSGVKNATPPPPQPVTVPQPPQPQQQQQPVQPAPKVVQPAPTLMQKFEHFIEPAPKPELVNPTPEPDQPQPHKIVINTQLVTGPVSQTTPKTTRTNHSQDRARAINNALKNLQNNLSPATQVEMPGNSSVAYANYASVVKSIYTQAWIPPNDTANDDANTKVSVTIASDGSVISATIMTPSGDANTDDSVQKTLDRVTFIAPFPDGATDKQRTYIINFNLKAKRMLE